MKTKPVLKLLLLIVLGIVVLLLLFSGVWISIVSTHLHQFDESILSQAALNAEQEALKEKAAYQAAEYRLKRIQMEAKNQYEMEKLRLKTEMLPRYTALKFYGMVSVFSVIGFVVILLSSGYVRSKIRRSSVCLARVGQHSAIPVHYRDLQNFYPIAVNLSLAEIEASASTAHEQAYQLSRQMIEDVTLYTRGVVAKQTIAEKNSERSAFLHSVMPTQVYTPTFAELLSEGSVAPGKPLVVGYSQGQPQYRSLQDLKSVAIAGWQGSGKTLSTAYIVASSVLSYGVRVYVVDPHKHHHEGLSSLIKPLEQTGQITVINPFDTPRLIADLNTHLDRRLAGQEANEPGLLLVIDELARLAEMECFDVLLAFLERCTEETRKANITFLGSSPKWTARHFKGRADIRGCMNSMLIHKTKPSQADLLLEDARDKHLVKQLYRPGDAILVTDYDPPTLISMPRCTRRDIESVAKLVEASQSRSESTVVPSKHPPAASDVIPLAHHRKKPESPYYPEFDAQQLTVELIRKQFDKRKDRNPTFTQAEFAAQLEISQSYLSKILSGQCPLSDKQKQKFYRALFSGESGDRLAMTG